MSTRCVSGDSDTSWPFMEPFAARASPAGAQFPEPTGLLGLVDSWLLISHAYGTYMRYSVLRLLL